MIRFSTQQKVTVLALAASAALTAAWAAETAAPAAPAAPAATEDKLVSVGVPTAPPREYVIPKKGVSAAIRKAVENPERRPEDRARDGYRKPAEVLALTGIKPNQKVIEFGSFGELDKFGQYYTTMLADIVGPKGMVYMYDPLEVDQQFGGNSRLFAKSRPNVKYEAVNFDKIQLPRGIDIAFSNLFYHEMLMRGVDMTVFHDKLFKALKPGGIYLVIDHAGTIGEDMKYTLPNHRLDPSVIRSGIQAAGFENVFPQDLRLLERTDDDKKWTIYTEGKADQTDQAVYMFRKPIVY
jgi:predicted methyltransferase